MTKVQATPGVDPSLVTEALTVTAADPAAIVPIGLVIVTVRVLFEFEPPPHPATTNAIAKYNMNFR